MVSTWKESLHKKLSALFGTKKAAALTPKYSDVFSQSYLEENSVERIASDIQYLEALSEKEPLQLSFYSTPNQEHSLHLRVYFWDKPMALSNLLPILENMDLRVDSDKTYSLTINKEKTLWISDFSVIETHQPLNVETGSALFIEAFKKIYFGISENDGFNKLILDVALTWREVMVIRAFAKYLRQVHFRYSQNYIQKALSQNPELTKLLVELFIHMHDPAHQTKSRANKIEQQLLQKLEAVTSLDEDQIIRRFLQLIKATLRTNYFQLSDTKQAKSYLSLKLNSRMIPDLPLPTPLYEIFVYSPEFEGIHLRNTKVARGGIRWSERPEDFRTEILGLMKAQKVKNSVIIPSGAKGGFVLKKLPPQPSREVVQAEVVRCYTAFISGLLDITDNIKGKKSLRPKNVVCYDDFDPYLVVAADKGTATFSDMANRISKSYDFWLGDAFASGGEKGYDHKKMGITAKGAWESVKRHFRELNIDTSKTDITVVGIGDMSGDVFGNGLIYSNHMKLVAAFDHRHIFLDPNPDPQKSYDERVRLFNLPTSSWENYNPKLISAGGGVFKRSLKSITLSPQMKKVLDVQVNSLSPNDLILAILKAPVQLLFNGGIGTYVKAVTESHFDVGDRTNDYCRVNGEDLRCQVVGEGGNLGFTQLARVEYAMKGGLINADFIDNSAGVDCSDHEVNLKILLDHQVQSGNLSEKQRDKLLVSLTDEISALVLNDNFEQAQLLSYSAYRSKYMIGIHSEYIKELEQEDLIDRKVEYLPDDKKLIERKANGDGLTRPELAVLVSYTKIAIKNDILASDLPEDTYLQQLVATAFPASISKKYKSAMNEHRLHRDIIATQLSNQVVNDMGITFVYRLQKETGATVAQVVRAYVIASRIFETRALQKLIQSLDFKIPMEEQYEMVFNIRHLINISTRWFIHRKHLSNDIASVIDYFREHMSVLEKVTPTLMGGATKEYLETLTKQFTSAGLSLEISNRIAAYRTIYSALNIIDVMTKNKFDLMLTTKTYYLVGEQFNLLWFRDQIGADTREGHWNTLSRLTIRDELDLAQCDLTTSILKKNKKETNVVKLIEKWVTDNQSVFTRWNLLLQQLHSSSNIDYAMFFIAMRELLSVVSNKTAQEM